MTNETKIQITADLRAYIARHESQNKAATTLKGASSAILSQMLNNRWEKISDDMWRNIAAQITTTTSNGWQLVETRDFKLINHLLKDAKQSSQVFAITGAAGSGKSITLKDFAERNKQVYLLSCAEYWNRKYFLSELLLVMGKDASGLTVADMMEEVVSTLKKQESPLIIMDEADKLTDQVLYFFITLYNQLEDQCGLVLCATDHLSKRIKKGLRLNKRGYQEIFSRMGRKFIELKGVGFTDVTQICIANGVLNQATIKQIHSDCENDLRRVKRLIHAESHKNLDKRA